MDGVTSFLRELDRIMPKKAAPTVDRRECDNCGNWFDINPQVPNKRFCRDACRKEFWHTGGQFRKVRRFAEKLLPQLVAAAFDKQRAELHSTLDEIRQERELIQGLVARFERARSADLIMAGELRRDPRPQSGAAA